MSQNKFFNEQSGRITLSEKVLGQYDQPRLKTSSSPSRIHLIKENFYGTRQKIQIIPNVVTNYNIQNLNLMDKDKMQEEIIKNKNNINRKNKEFRTLKIAFMKLEAENKRNIKIIEEILEEATKQKKTGDEEENDIKNLIAKSNLTMNSLMKLREAHLVNTLKGQVHEYKLLLNSKEEEIGLLKNSTKVSKYHDLDTKMKNTLEEYNNMTENYIIIKQSYLEKENKLKEATEEKDYYKTMMMRIKSQFDEIKEKSQYYQDQNIKLTNANKILEEKNSNNKFKENTYRTQIREKDNIINSLKEEIKSYEHFKIEKENLDKKIANLLKNLNSSKDEIERKNWKVKDYEKSNNQIKARNDYLMSENKKLQLNSSLGLQKDNEKKMKILEDIIEDLQKENKKLKEEILLLTNMNGENNFLKKSEEFEIKNTMEENKKEITYGDYEEIDNKNNENLIVFNDKDPYENEPNYEKDVVNKQGLNLEKSDKKLQIENKHDNNEENIIENNRMNTNEDKLEHNQDENTEENNYENNFENHNEHNNENDFEKILKTNKNNLDNAEEEQ